METLADKKNLLPLGEHIATIRRARITYSNKNAEWDDFTPQLELTFENEHGFVRKWFNLVGFMRFEELTNDQKESGRFKPTKSGYAIQIIPREYTDLRIRVFSEEKTRKCLEMIKDFAWIIGVKHLNFIPDDLTGHEVKITVNTDKNGKIIVSDIKPLSLSYKLENLVGFDGYFCALRDFYNYNKGLLL